MLDHLQLAETANLVSEVLSDQEPLVKALSHSLLPNQATKGSILSQPKEQTIFTIDDLLILPGRISHTRLFPAFHSFVYSYLMVGIPLHSLRDNWLLTVDEPAWWKRGWLRVEASDHLERGGNGHGIRRKLEVYLQSQGVNGADFPKVYLITSPRFLNYKFSPASFWYLYSANDELKAMIVEVNNTFDERRMYYLPYSMDQEDNLRKGESQVTEKNPPDLPSISRPFKHTWSKDFHVSPFNSRKGKYSLSACDPAQSHRPNHSNPRKIQAFVDIKAGLLSSKSRPKMTVRVWSTASPLDPATMSIWRSLIFFCSWWWVGILTYPRILVEAIKLAYKRKLSIWYLPEVRRNTVARKATTEEISLAKVFGRYLAHLVSQSEAPMQLQYTSIAKEVQCCTMATPTFQQTEKQEEPFQANFRVLTPSFYSRVFSHWTLNAALDTEVISTSAEENRTAEITDASSDLHAKLTEANDISMNRKSPNQPADSLLDRLLWNLLYKLRQDPEPGSYPSPGHPKTRLSGAAKFDKSSEPKRSTITTSKANPTFLDVFVRNHCESTEQREYRRTLIRLFIARRIAFENVNLLRLYGMLLRGIVGALAARLLPGTEDWISYVLAMIGCYCIWGWLEGIVLVGPAGAGSTA